MYLCCSTIQKNSKINSQTTENELIRVMIHGVLHCMGYNDKNDKQKKIMRNMENSFLEMFHVKQFKNV